MKIKKFNDFYTLNEYKNPVFKGNPNGFHIDLYIGVNCQMDSSYHLRTSSTAVDRRAQLANDIENLVYTTLLDNKDILGLPGLSVGDNSFKYRNTYKCEKYTNAFGVIEVVCKAYGLNGIENLDAVDIEPFVMVKNEIQNEIQNKLKNETVSANLRIVKDFDDNVYIDTE